LKKIFSSKSKPINNGIYFWGGVGRGKSFLMDSFYLYLKQDYVDLNITRIHFHEFMRNVHKELEYLCGIADPIDSVAKKIAGQYKIICFDEFHINDIADAMIFDRLFHALFKYNIFFVLTSNYNVSDLYLNGLHRDRFLPAIDLLQQHLQVINLDGGNDYRLRSLEQMNIYHTPITDATNSKLLDSFNKLAQNTKNIEQNCDLYIENRKIHAKYKCDDVVWFNFKELCDSPRSQNDYLELSLQFNTIILSDIPYMPPKMSTPARRFTWLIDILYDHKVNLIMSADVVAEELYTEGLLANEFHRTVSRIIEMQSKEYLELSHKLHTS
jgi:cell division protein ZapE